MKAREYKISVALCPSGRISEIKEGHVPPTMMLPPCSSQDLPTWVHMIDYNSYAELKKDAQMLVEALEKHQCALYEGSLK